MNMDVHDRKFIESHNSLCTDPTRKINEKILRCFKKNLSIKKPTIKKHRDKLVNWITSTTYQKDLNLKILRNNFEYFNYKTNIIFSDKKINKPGVFYLGRSSTQRIYWQAIYSKHYFTKRMLLDDFLKLDLEYNKNDQKEGRNLNKIKNFIEQYSVCFINYQNLFNYQDGLETYFDVLIKNYLFFKNFYKLLLEDKKFPYKIKEPALKSKHYWHWYNKYARLLFALNEEKIFIKNDCFLPLKCIIKEPKTNIPLITDEFPYLINLLYGFIIQERAGLERCGYCKVLFVKRRKDQKGCCPNHSKSLRDEKYREKMA
ncbi:MAG: hypothetical protein PHV78_01710 [Patescibacteria group bacterium]|nr:hypothetical protein [Patescibacteria group bacterium]MDD5121133.1 hypothetical protein [Patescibacteria group bacterium]MDD5395948.1 hypothetical protein [Patescibacteria group bacterium]